MPSERIHQNVVNFLWGTMTFLVWPSPLNASATPATMILENRQRFLTGFTRLIEVYDSAVELTAEETTACPRAFPVVGLMLRFDRRDQAAWPREGFLARNTRSTSQSSTESNDKSWSTDFRLFF